MHSHVHLQHVGQSSLQLLWHGNVLNVEDELTFVLRTGRQCERNVDRVVTRTARLKTTHNTMHMTSDIYIEHSIKRVERDTEQALTAQAILALSESSEHLPLGRA